LKRVHPELKDLITFALQDSPLDFGITQGSRTYEEQKANVAAGVSQTMNSRHLLRLPAVSDANEKLVIANELDFTKRYAHAVDIVCYIEGKVTWAWPAYERVAKHILTCAAVWEVDLTWGGHWTSLRDGPHFELSWEKYPVKTIPS
jgi:peptidoglycan L-alanyl-D-glutamate endopeptidase CwlK